MKSNSIAMIGMLLMLALVSTSEVSAAKKGADKIDKNTGQEFKVEKRKSSTFGLSPISKTVVAVAGQKTSVVLKISNPTSYVSAYSAQAIGFLASPQGLVQKPVSALLANNLARHVSFEPSPPFVVPPKSEKEFNLIINVPSDVIGTQYVGIEVANTTPPDLDLSRKGQYQTSLGVGMQPGLLSTIKVNIEGTLKTSYKLHNIEIIKAEGNRPPVAKATLSNTGNSELILFPVLILFDEGNKGIVARFKPRSSSPVVPGGKTTIEFEPSSSAIAPGKYKAVLSFVGKDAVLPPSEQAVIVK